MRKKQYITPTIQTAIIDTSLMLTNSKGEETIPVNKDPQDIIDDEDDVL